MEKKGVMLIVFAILLLGFASARISVSDVNDVYNLGDKVYVTVDMIPGNVDGNFEINLICNNNSINLYKVPAEASFAPGTEQKVSTFATLSPSLMNNSIGDCFLSASIGGEFAQTKTFKVSNTIIVNAKLDNVEYNPGETISLQVDATKANGQLLEGFMEASGATIINKAITKGQLVEKFSMPATAAAGTYTLNLFVYDKKDTTILNTANASLSFNIRQVPTLLQLSLDKTEISPEDNLTIGADLYDQAGKNMPSQVSIRVVSPTNVESVLSMNSSETTSFNFPLNSTSGKWIIYASSMGTTDQKDIQVDEIQKVSFEFVNGTSVLLVKNIGNSPYNKPINVSMGNETRTLDLLNIAPGEERKFSLSAPDGEYNVEVSDNNSNFEQRVFLTGNAISVKDFSGLNILSKYPLVWMFLVIILAGFLVVVVIKYFRKKTFKIGSLFESKKLFPESKKVSEMDRSFIDTAHKVGDAESSMVSKGQRTNSAVLVAKVKNLNENARKEVEKIVSKARLRKGVVEWKDDYVLVIFSPQITKSSANEWTAAKVGYDMYKELQDYNKKFSEKIDFGIGIHSGDLISAVENGKFRYTSVGGAIVFAKKIADFNTGKIVISEDARRKIMKDLKVQKTSDIGSKATYEITGVTDREVNKGKLDDLLKRMGK